MAYPGCDRWTSKPVSTEADRGTGQVVMGTADNDDAKTKEDPAFLIFVNGSSRLDESTSIYSPLRGILGWVGLMTVMLGQHF